MNYPMGKKSSLTKPIYADMIQAAKLHPEPEAGESFNRLERKDFWNDPERWDGIDDTHATMIWEVRRPDRIDVRGKSVDDDALRNIMEAQKASYDAQLAFYQNQLQQSLHHGRYLNALSMNQYGNLFGNLLGY